MKSCFDEISKSLLQSDEISPRQLEYPEDFPEAMDNDKRNGPRKVLQLNITSDFPLTKFISV